MSENEFETGKIPALGKGIASLLLKLGAVFRADWIRTVVPQWDKLTSALKRHYLTPIYVLAFLLTVPWALLVFEIAINLFEQLSVDTPTKPDERRAHFYSLGLTITGLGAVLAAPLVLVKSWVNERQARTAEEGLITDRITKAIEQLGAEKTVKATVDRERVIDGETIIEQVVDERTEPNLEVRLGAIYAL